MITLINFSGGIDSTYCLYKYMKDYKKSDETVIVHHNILVNNTGRWEKELEACHKILDWLKEHGLDDFKYVETKFEQPKEFKMPLDSILHKGYISGVIALTYNISHIVYSTPRDEYERMGIIEMRRRSKNAEAVRKIVCGRTLSVIDMISNTKKKTLMKEMPKDLLDMCWFCRIPDADGKPCGACHTCKSVLPILEQINTEIK
ncbi:MAG: hypothetical protein M0Q88_01055 [Bacilli bacterium]|nr:hypothetical protein [Bacilli bacterium]